MEENLNGIKKPEHKCVQNLNSSYHLSNFAANSRFGKISTLFNHMIGVAINNYNRAIELYPNFCHGIRWVLFKTSVMALAKKFCYSHLSKVLFKQDGQTILFRSNIHQKLVLGWRLIPIFEYKTGILLRFQLAIVKTHRTAWRLPKVCSICWKNPKFSFSRQNQK